MAEFTNFDYVYPLERIVLKDYGQVYYRPTYHPPGDRVSVIRELIHKTYGNVPGNYTHEIHRIR